MTNTREIWAKTSAASNAFNEKNDCTVRAIAIAADLPYTVAHKAMAAAGRKPRQGAMKISQVKAMKALGFSLAFSIEADWFWDDERQKPGPGRKTFDGAPVLSMHDMVIGFYPNVSANFKNATVAQAKRFKNTEGWKRLAELSRNPNVAIHIHTRGHVSAYQNGDVIDWAQSRKMRIQEIYVFAKPGVQLED